MEGYAFYFRYDQFFFSFFTKVRTITHDLVVFVFFNLVFWGFNVAGNETFERLAAFGLFANFMVYLTREFHLDQVYASNILNLWSGVTNFFPLIGAFISDAYVGRFRTIAFCSFSTLLVLFSLPLSMFCLHFE